MQFTTIKPILLSPTLLVGAGWFQGCAASNKNPVAATPDKARAYF